MPDYKVDPCVEVELWEIWCFIAQDNPEAATRLIDSAYDTFKFLSANPDVGARARLRDRKLRDVRTWRVSDFPTYLIFYRRSTDGVHILHVYHGARDIEKLLRGH